MLVELTVENFGIIETISWSPAAGLNVITGETGAGKSLVVDAVEALLTGQISETDIRHGADAARIEGVFETDKNPSSAGLTKLLAEKGLEGDDATLLVTCDFRRQGRAAPRVNRQAVARALLREITAALLDIHGQSQHLSLLNRERHRDYLDAYAHTRGQREDFSRRARELNEMEKEIQKLSAGERDTARQRELLEFQIEEISRAELQPGEEAELETEQARLVSAEKLKAAAAEAYRALSGDDNAMSATSAVDKLNEALSVLRPMAETDPAMKPRRDYLEEMLYGLEETAREVRTYGDSLEDDPARLEEVQSRLALIKNLKRKYGDTIDSVLEYQNKAESELAGLTSSGERRQQLEEQREQLRIEMGKIAGELSEKRTAAALKLAEAVKRECRELSLAQVDFAVEVSREVSPEGIPLPDGKTCRFDSGGVDSVAFLAVTNPGEPLQPLDSIASTGEISRFMLAMKSALAEADMIPVLIFDEIDIGVGGRSGEVIGRKLWDLSRRHQVICVTHLPQIAAFADAHFNVSKQSVGDRTVSTLTPLDGESRLNELATMLGGAQYTNSARTAAGELMDKAGAWKQKHASG